MARRKPFFGTRARPFFVGRAAGAGRGAAALGLRPSMPGQGLRPWPGGWAMPTRRPRPAPAARPRNDKDCGFLNPACTNGKKPDSSCF